MKLDALFTVKENKLYKIQDDSLVDISSLEKINIPWTSVELEPESYNEEYLAELRNQLKILDETNKFALLIPVVDKPLDNPEQIELFINAFNHTARRIKDCISVVGLELPEAFVAAGFSAESPAVSFIETLSKKHPQYVYFAKAESVSDTSIVLY